MTLALKQLARFPIGVQLLGTIPALYLWFAYATAHDSAAKNAVIMAFGSALFWFGASVCVMSMTVSLTVKLLASRELTEDEEFGSTIAFFCALGLMACAWWGYDGSEYNALGIEQSFVIFIVAYCLFCLPILKQILCRVGIFWYLASLVFMLLLVTILRNVNGKD